MRKKVVFVGLSGGVDSAVSAALLQKQGFEVVGVFIKTWHPDFLECNEEEERRDAMRVAAFLGIPFLTFDFENIYKKEVADYMIREYRAGRTPNPDVMCNKEVKFGAFLKKAVAMGADFVATGHYAKNTFFQARTQPGHSKKYFLLYKGIDPSKDQSYFLWTLNQDQLSKIIFPISDLKKTEVRKLAKKFNLPVADKKDSQGICFLGEVDLKEFLKHYIKIKKGKVLNTDGETIGYHNGVVFYTLGERHGFTITRKGSNDSRYYIVSKDIKKNVLIVSSQKNNLNSNTRTDYSIENTNWINEKPKLHKNYTAQIRYHGEFLSCTIKILTQNKARVFFTEPILVAPGQSIVLYDNDICLGGGVVVDGVPYINSARTINK